MPLRAADFESAAYAIPPLRAGPKCRHLPDARHVAAKTQRCGALGGQCAWQRASDVPAEAELSVPAAELARIRLVHTA